MKITSRLPTGSQTLVVFSVAAFITYSWSLYSVFYMLPSWSLYLTFGDIFGMLAYTFCFDFIESLAILCGLLIFSFILPPWMFARKFATIGSAILFVAAIAILLNNYFNLSIAVYSLFILPMLLLAWAIHRWQTLESKIDSFVERFTVFLYFLAPLSALGLLVVLVRNV